MNRQVLIRTALLTLCAALCAGRPAAVGEPLAYGSVTVDSEAEYVDLGEEQIRDWDGFYAFLSRLPRLQRADLFATKAGVSRVEELHEKFPGVEFGMTMRIGDHELRTDATAFSTLHTSRSVRHTDRELSLVRYCTNLYALDLGHNTISDLRFLRDLPELRVLIIAMDQIEDIALLAELKHLEYLEIFHNRISDISCLSGLPYLTDLNLVKNNIADLTPLTEIRSLRRLWMNQYDAGLSGDQIRGAADRIREALPLCEVDEVSSAVGGTWREHPHYEVIRRIFETGVYEPFADSPEKNRVE